MLLRRSVFDYDLVEERPGFISVVFYGKGSQKLFSAEGGGHRWQRVSPTEKKGRIHTSTVTVAVLQPVKCDFSFNYKDISVVTTRGSGPGGQHRNKTDSCVVATHEPSGISVRVDMKSQKQSKETAFAILEERIKEHTYKKSFDKHNKKRCEQIGSGMRGDKIRTYRTQDDSVVDHRTGKRLSLKKWLKGKWN